MSSISPVGSPKEPMNPYATPVSSPRRPQSSNANCPPKPRLKSRRLDNSSRSDVPAAPPLVSAAATYVPELSLGSAAASDMSGEYRLERQVNLMFRSADRQARALNIIRAANAALYARDLSQGEPTPDSKDNKQ